MSPIQQMLLGVGAVATKTYVDDIFSNYLWKATNADRSINIGFDYSNNEGLVWIKNREGGDDHVWYDTLRGANKRLSSNSNAAETTTTTELKSFTSTGYTLGNHGTVNGNDNFSSWNFKSAPGFFDVITYTGNGSNRTISHDLGCVPGCIFVKRLDSPDNWVVYHRGNADTNNAGNYFLRLDTTSAKQDSSNRFNDTDPTASVFSVGTDGGLNDNGGSYVAYLFAGGESDAATARSVDFGSSSYLSIPDHAHNWTFESNPFTIEMWVKSPDAHAGYETLVSQWGSSQQSWSVRYSSADVGSNWSFFYSSSGSNSFSIDGGAKIDDNQWHHIAVVRTGGNPNLFKLYTDGKLTGQSSSSSNTALHYSTADVRIGSDGFGNDFTGSISNLRIIRLTAHYTSSFRVPTAPLPDTGRSAFNNNPALTAGTVLLCCNNSSVTGSTFSSGTISSSGSNVTASIDSPFDDPAGFVFGENEDQNVIKSGSYVGSGSAGLEVNVGFEPQWLLIKNTSVASQWVMFDVMRGIVSNGSDTQLFANDNGSEDGSSDWIDVTPTGFKLNLSHRRVNQSGNTFVYTCIRRSDGYVGKPPELGNQVFTPVFGSANAPLFKANNHVVDFTLQKNSNFATQSADWNATSRLTSGKLLQPNTNAAETSNTFQVFDYQSGTSSFTGGSGIRFGWLWKRHAGFDVVCDVGTQVAKDIPHSLNAVPEMMIRKNRTNANSWVVYHKDLPVSSGGDLGFMYLNSTSAADTTSLFWTKAPTSTYFSVGTDIDINQNNKNIITMLFASVNNSDGDPISKVGSYTGNGSTGQTITLGFQPRFVIIRKYNDAAHWLVLDTTRGWGSGDDKYLLLNSNGAQGNYEVGAPVSNGFTLVGDNDYNNSSGTYIYYAHA